MEEHIRRLANIGRALNNDDGIAYRHTAALARAKTGQVDQALAEWKELQQEAQRILGAHHPQTRKIDEQIKEYSSRRNTNT